MTIYGTILPGAATIARSAALTGALTERAKYKIKILDWYKFHKENASLTSRHFSISRMTLYRWLKSFQGLGVIGLNERSRRSKPLRQPITPSETIIKIIQLRKQYPAWSKYKIKAFLVKVYASESSRNGALFLDECLLNFPFTIKAVQTDNGSTWQKEFEKLCKERLKNGRISGTMFGHAKPWVNLLLQNTLKS